MAKVLIGCQARTNSVRLPGKSHLHIGNKSLVATVLDRSVKAAGWAVEKKLGRVSIILLVPQGDPLKDEFSHKYEVFEGPEDDVLTRYHNCATLHNFDYVMRLTGDCVWLPASVIFKCLKQALIRETDYCSNVLFRSFVEGYDCEILSRRALEYAHKQAVTPEDREHVTTFLIRDILNGNPTGLKVHTVFNEYDLSDVKTSIDTQEEFMNSLAKFDILKDKKRDATRVGSISF